MGTYKKPTSLIGETFCETFRCTLFMDRRLSPGSRADALTKSLKPNANQLRWLAIEPLVAAGNLVDLDHLLLAKKRLSYQQAVALNQSRLVYYLKSIDAP
ncbi:unnamed protein product, partial [Protopolystoma xenopodis]